MFHKRLACVFLFLLTSFAMAQEKVECSDDHIRVAARKFGSDYSKLYNLISHTVVSIKSVNNEYPFHTKKLEPECSGFFIENTKQVATNFHCAIGVSSTQAVLTNGATVNVRGVVGYSGEYDLAIFELEKPVSDAIPIDLSRIPPPQEVVGERVMALPGCHTSLSGTDPLGGHGIGIVEKVGSTELTNAYRVNSALGDFGGKSGSLVINDNYEAIGVFKGSVVSEVTYGPNRWAYANITLSNIANLKSVLRNKVSLSLKDASVEYQNHPAELLAIASVSMADGLMDYGEVLNMLSLSSAMFKESRIENSMMYNHIAGGIYFLNQATMSTAEALFEKILSKNQDTHILFSLGLYQLLYKKDKAAAKRYFEKSFRADENNWVAKRVIDELSR